MTENLKERRKKLGLSQMDLAQKVGVSLLTIQLWERGVSMPNEQNSVVLEKVMKEMEKSNSSKPRGKATNGTNK